VIIETCNYAANMEINKIVAAQKKKVEEEK